MYTEIDCRPYDFYFENEIEFLKTDFTKNHFIIFMIFGNFWETFRITLFLGFSGVFPDTEEIVPYIPPCLFPILSPSLNADLTYLGFCIYCEDPPHVAFNALQIKSHQVILIFSLLYQTQLLAFPLNAALIPAFGPFWPKRRRVLRLNERNARIHLGFFCFIWCATLSSFLSLH